MKKVVVFGSFVADLTSRAPHLPVAGETVMGTRFKLGPGGKGTNQGVAAHRAGADIVMVTKVGNDAFGKMALDNFKAEGMDTRYILTDEQKETGSALIMVDEKTGQNMILVVSGACANFTPDDLERIEPVIAGADILLVQLETNMDATEKCVAVAYRNGVDVVLNPAPAGKIADGLLKKVKYITPNEVEAALLTGVKIERPEDAQKAAEVFLKRGVQNVVITLGGNGVYVSDGKRDEHLPPFRVKAVETTGAGDAFNGGFVTALAEGLNVFAAAGFGNAVGALAVTRMGTAPAMPYRHEIDAFLMKNANKS